MLLVFILFTLYKSDFFINSNTLFYIGIRFRKICISMPDNLYEIDSAMNMIKEEIIRELSECVSKQNKSPYYRKASSNKLSFSEKTLD